MCAPNDRSLDYYQPMHQNTPETTFSCSVDDEWDPVTRRAVLLLDDVTIAPVHEINGTHTLNEGQFGKVAIALR